MDTIENVVDWRRRRVGLKENQPTLHDAIREIATTTPSDQCKITDKIGHSRWEQRVVEAIILGKG